MNALRAGRLQKQVHRWHHSWRHQRQWCCECHSSGTARRVAARASPRDVVLLAWFGARQKDVRKCARPRLPLPCTPKRLRAGMHSARACGMTIVQSEVHRNSSGAIASAARWPCRYCAIWQDLGLRCHIVRPTIWQTMVPVLAERLALRVYADVFANMSSATSAPPTSSHKRGSADDVFDAAAAALDGTGHNGQQQLGQCGGFVVHTFSNGGFLALSAVLQLQQAMREQASGGDASRPGEQLRGIVFDSAPARITPDIVIRCGRNATSKTAVQYNSAFQGCKTSSWRVHSRLTKRCAPAVHWRQLSGVRAQKSSKRTAQLHPFGSSLPLQCLAGICACLPSQPGWMQPGVRGTRTAESQCRCHCCFSTLGRTALWRRLKWRRSLPSRPRFQFCATCATRPLENTSCPM
jgi:Eukaryotic protein of unknown function (DUF829)